MIEGVAIKKLKLLKDERGFLMEIIRSDEKDFKKFGQSYLTACKPNIAKAWHWHKTQTDRFICVSGTVKVLLFDRRKNSKTYGQIQEIVLKAPDLGDEKYLLRIEIPPKVAHGFTALGNKIAVILNYPNQLYNYKNPDEQRIPWNSPEIPYKWGPKVKKGR